MTPERLPEPWHSFLVEIDRAAPEPLELTCIGLNLLERRYRDEFRPIAVGPAERHDQTLALWIEAIREGRSAGRQ